MYTLQTAPPRAREFLLCLHAMLHWQEKAGKAEQDGRPLPCLSRDRSATRSETLGKLPLEQDDGQLRRETGMQSHTLAVTWDKLLRLSCLHTKQAGPLGRGPQAPPAFWTLIASLPFSTRVPSALS